MRNLCWALVSLGLCLGTLPAQGQPKSDSVQDLRRQIRVLEEKLETLEGGQQEKQRVVQLGTSHPREREPQLVVRVYDVSDLFAVAPAYPAMCPADLGGEEKRLFPAASGAGPTSPFVISVVPVVGMGGMGGGSGIFNVAEKPATVSPPGQPILRQHTVGGTVSGETHGARTSLETLIDAITSTIAPTEWDTVGGAGSIAPLGTNILVSATPRVHEQIDSLLASFRKRWGTLRTVSVQANWLWLTEQQAQSVLSPADPQARQAGELSAFGLVDEAKWNAIRRDLEKLGDAWPVGYQAVVTGYNGQTVHALAGVQRRFIVELTPVVGGEAEKAQVAYQPRAALVQDGAALEVTPMVTVAGKFVVLDVHARVLQVRDAARAEPPRPKAAGSASVVAAIDRPLLMSHRLATTIRLPVDRRMLVGGMTCEGRPQPGEPNLYLFVKAAVQELRDDLPEKENKPVVEPEP